MNGTSVLGQLRKLVGWGESTQPVVQTKVAVTPPAVIDPDAWVTPDQLEAARTIGNAKRASDEAQEVKDFADKIALSVRSAIAERVEDPRALDTFVVTHEEWTPGLGLPNYLTAPRDDGHPDLDQVQLKPVFQDAALAAVEAHFGGHLILKSVSARSDYDANEGMGSCTNHDVQFELTIGPDARNHPLLGRFLAAHDKVVDEHLDGLAAHAIVAIKRGLREAVEADQSGAPAKPASGGVFALRADPDPTRTATFRARVEEMIQSGPYSVVSWREDALPALQYVTLKASPDWKRPSSGS